MEKISAKLSLITKEFLEMKKIAELPWQCISDCLSSKNLHQEELVDITINHPIARKYSPSSDYIKLFIKTLIRKIEESNIEVSEQVYKLFIQYLNATNKNDYFYRTYTFNGGIQITLRETNSLIAYGTTGLTTWQAGHALAQFCLKENLKLESSNILELGSGLGLSGLSVIKNNKPISYTFTDHHHSVLDILKHNVTINLDPKEGMKQIEEDSHHMQWNETEIYIKNLDWENPGEVQEYDIILGADVLFDIQLFSPLLAVIAKALKPLSSKAIIAATVRNKETIECFLKEIEISNLCVTESIEKKIQKSCSEPEEIINIISIVRPL